MTKDNEDALALAGEVDEVAKTYPDMAEVSACIRRLVRENEFLSRALANRNSEVIHAAQQLNAKDALLRQAVEALEAAKHNTTHGQIAWNCKEVIAAIRQHLEGRA